MRLAGRLLSARPLSTSALGGAAASAAAQLTFNTWHSAVTAAMSGAPDEAMAQLRTRMQPECIFRPPTYFKPWAGRDETLLLLTAVSEVFGPSFRYKVQSRATFPPPRSLTPACTLTASASSPHHQRQWLSDDGRDWALEFEAQIGESGKTLHGIDLVNLTDGGLIAELSVLARPPNAVEALRQEMMRRVPVRLARLKARQALGLAPS